MTKPFRSDFIADQQATPFNQSNSKGILNKRRYLEKSAISREEGTPEDFSNPRKKTGRARQLGLATRECLGTALSRYCKLIAPDSWLP